MSLRAVSRLLAIALLSVGSCVALAITAGDVPPSLRAAIEKATYQIEPERKARTVTTYVASSRAQGMRFSFTSSGVLVCGASSGEPWNLGMSLKSWGYGNEARSVRPARLAVSGDRIEYRRGPLTEWYSNSRAGLEQGFTVRARPAAGRRNGTLRLGLTLSGDLVPLLAGEGGSLLLVRAGGNRVLRFAGLTAFDATGRSLPSRMELRERELALLVDDTAALYPVTVDPLLTRETKLTASDPAIFARFGWSVALDRDTAVVGSIFNAAYVFARSGGTWTLQQKLTASDGIGFELFGSAVAVNHDTIVVGSVFSGDLSSPYSGAAYVFVRSGGVWAERQKLTPNDPMTWGRFGYSVAINGDTILIGTPGASDAGSTSGAAYLFARTAGVWALHQKLTASDAAAGNEFGDSVALTSDTAVVGSPLSGDAGFASGAAYVFVRNGTAWNQQQKLTASDPAPLDAFGYSVAVTGDTAVIGAPSDSRGSLPGSAYAFTRSGGLWSQHDKLTAAGGAPGGEFGFSVALGEDKLIVGSVSDDTLGLDAGSAYVFARSGGAWNQQQKLTASDGAALGLFGFSVAVSSDTILVGSPDSGFPQTVPYSGSAYVYEPELTALSPAKVWVGLKNSNDVNMRLDLLAEAFIDAMKVGQGELDNVGGGSSGFNNALLMAIPLALTGGPVSAPSGAQLSIRVSARRTCFGRGISGAARLWYNGQPVDSGAGRDAGSRFGATIGGTTSDEFLRSGFALSTTAGSSRTSADAFVNSSAPCPARPFTSFGTWSRTLP